MNNDEIPVGKAKDLRGLKFGKLTVLYRVENIYNRTTWKCKCDCGKYVIVTKDHLFDGNTKSCGCLPKLDLSGKKFDKLLVLKKANDKQNDRIVWECVCDCGKKCCKYTSYLTNKNSPIKSCGCTRKKYVIKNKSIKKIKNKSLKEIKSKKDLIGKKFGKLIVKASTEQRTSSGLKIWLCECEECKKEYFLNTKALNGNKNATCYYCLIGKKFGRLTVKDVLKKYNRTYLKCKCECGSIKEIRYSHLIDKNTMSCGCLISKGEEKILKILKKHNIEFQTQKIFEDCCFEETGGFARFDFFVNNKYLIEYDGIQHYTYTGHGWCTEENFLKIQKRDNYKNQWCEKNNIPLIRIPYTKFDSLNIEDLMLETSKYRIV